MNYSPERIAIPTLLQPLFTGLLILGLSGWTCAEEGRPQSKNAAPTLGMNAGDKATAFIRKYCLDCHGGEHPEGDRRLNDLAVDFIANRAMAERWQEVLHQLQLGEMPPADAPQPAEEERQQVVGWIERQMVDAISRERARGGKVVQRRMNRHEYLHAVRDLFGFREGDFDPTSAFPAEEEADGFRNNGAVLRTSSYLMEQYFAAADMVLQRAYDEARVEGPAKSQTWICVPETYKLGAVATGIGVTKTTPPRIYVSQGIRSHETDYKPKLFLDQLTASGVPHSGWYEVEVDVAGMNRRHPYGSNLMPGYLRPLYPNPKVFFDPDSPMLLSIGQEKFRPLSETRRVAPKFQATAEVPDDTSKTIRFRVWIDRGNSPYLCFANGPAEGTKMQFVTNQLHKFDPGVPRISPKVRNNLTERFKRNEPYYDRYKGPELHIARITVSGPAPQESAPDALRLLFATVTPGETDVSAVDLRAELCRIATRLFRRPVAVEEIERHAKVIESRLAQKMTYAQAAYPAFKALLCAPDFLFLVEPADAGKALDARQLATRLSFFLWSSVPDTALSTKADDGSLAQPAVLAAEVNRMLQDPKSERLAQHFTEQWLGLNKLGSMAPGMEKFPDYYLFRLEPAMKEETWRFFHEHLSRNLPATGLVNAQFTYANEGLSRLYGLAPLTGEHLRRVSLPADAGRHGLLGHASVLTVTSNGVETSPVIRGVWLLKNVFGTPPSPPPPDVPALEPDIRGSTTIRDLLARHRAVKACNSCHQRIDPLGFALENFDPIGRSRVAYPNGVPIDTSAVYRGTRLSGAGDIRTYLLNHPSLLTRHVAKMMLTYALGRSLDFPDQPHVDRIVQAWEGKGNGVKDLVLLIAESELFRSH